MGMRGIRTPHKPLIFKDLCKILVIFHLRYQVTLVLTLEEV